MKKESSHTWHATEYHLNSEIQKKSGLSLIEQLHLRGNERVLDVGCGDGKTTAEISRRVPLGSVLGVDLSKNMIEFACKTFPKSKFKNLSFKLNDAQELNWEEEFDVIFSSFTIQWCANQDSFFRTAFTSLKSPGRLAITVPLGISSALEQAIHEIISLSQWSKYFADFMPGWHFTNEKGFLDLLSANSFFVLALHTIVEKIRFQSRKSLESYILPWFSYLDPLSSRDKPLFFKQIIDRYLQIEPQLHSGEINFSFHRIELIASKLNR